MDFIVMQLYRNLHRKQIIRLVMAFFWFLVVVYRLVGQMR